MTVKCAAESKRRCETNGWENAIYLARNCRLAECVRVLERRPLKPLWLSKMLIHPSSRGTRGPGAGARCKPHYVMYTYTYFFVYAPRKSRRQEVPTGAHGIPLERRIGFSCSFHLLSPMPQLQKNIFPSSSLCARRNKIQLYFRPLNIVRPELS